MKKDTSIKSKLLIFLSTILIVLTILLPLLIFPMKSLIYEAKQEILHKLSPSSADLQSIIIAENTFKSLGFHQDMPELNYQGSMYDVFSIEKKGHNFVIKALKDAEENALFANFTNNNTSKQTNQLISFFFFPAAAHLSYLSLKNPSAFLQEHAFVQPRFHLQNPALQVFSPPPNC